MHLLRNLEYAHSMACYKNTAKGDDIIKKDNVGCVYVYTLKQSQ